MASTTAAAGPRVVKCIKPEPRHAKENKGYLCVSPADRFVVENCGDRFHAAGVPGQHSPPCTNARPRVQKFKVGDSAWFEAPDKGHRCVAVPMGKKVWFRIKPGQSWKQKVPSDCRSGVMALNGPNQYAATFFLCTKRPHAQDEVVATAK